MPVMDMVRHAVRGPDRNAVRADDRLDGGSKVTVLAGVPRVDGLRPFTFFPASSPRPVRPTVSAGACRWGADQLDRGVHSSAFDLLADLVAQAVCIRVRMPSRG